MTSVAIVDKAPRKKPYDFKRHFDFPFDLLYLTTEDVPKVYKRHVTLDPKELDNYELVILVGSEAVKFLTSVNSVINYQGALIDDKFVPIINPSMLYFKPEGRPAFQNAVKKISEYYNGVGVKKPKIFGISEVNEAEKYLQKILDQEKTHVALDCETTALYPRDGYVLGISITCEETEGAYILSEALTERGIDLLQKIVFKHNIVFHNAKFDVKMLQYHYGITFPDFDDTMLEHYVLDENDYHGLKPLCIKFTNLGNYDAKLDAWKDQYCKAHGIPKKSFTYDLIPFDIMSEYAAYDAVGTKILNRLFKPVIEKNDKLNKVYRDILIRGTKFLVKVEENGCPVSRDRLHKAEYLLNRRLYKYNQYLYKFPEVIKFESDQSKPFNPNSVVQLRKLLFDYIGLEPTGIKTDAGADSTDSDVLEMLGEYHNIPKAILKIRQTSKILNTYISKMLKGLDADERLRTNFNLHITTSGRLSSSGKLNLQQLPRKDKFVKWSIASKPGYKIVSFDLGTAEMYYVSVLSGDKELQRIFIEGGDFHTETAISVFNLHVPKNVENRKDYVEEHYPDKRQAAKSISFGVLYGSGPAKVAQMSNCTLEEAKQFIKAYYKKFSGLKRWLDTNKQIIEDQGFIYSAFGRKRRLPNVKSVSGEIRGHEIRSGINFLVQSVASDANLMIAMDMQDDIEKSDIDAKIFALVHDSVLAEVKVEDVETYLGFIDKNVKKDRGVSIPGTPIVYDFAVGNDYKEAA